MAVIRSEYPDVEIVDRPIHDVVLGNAAEYGEREAMVDGITGRAISYAQLDHMTRRLAAGYAAAGIGKGDVIALHSPNTIMYPVAFYAATRAGATVTTVNALYHRNIGTNVAQGEAMLDMVEDERLIAILPFFHIYGMAVLMNIPLRLGATVVVLPKFDLQQFLTTLQDHRITRAYVAPPVVLALAKHPAVDGYDLSALKHVVSAAAPLDGQLGEACAKRLGLRAVLQAYGMTELSPGTHAIRADDPEPPPGAVGKLFPSTEMRLVDAEGNDADSGEIWIRGPQVMKGYLGRPGDTDTMIDADGWLHTGDIGRMDDRGYLYVIDRLKELIKYKGYQVPPAELEAVLLTDPRIADAAVIGVVDDERNEVPKAFVVKAAPELTEQDVIDYVGQRVAPHKKVRQVEFIDAVPKAASGKILRRELRAR